MPIPTPTPTFCHSAVLRRYGKSGGAILWKCCHGRYGATLDERSRGACGSAALKCCNRPNSVSFRKSRAVVYLCVKGDAKEGTVGIVAAGYVAAWRATPVVVVAVIECIRGWFSKGCQEKHIDINLNFLWRTRQCDIENELSLWSGHCWKQFGSLHVRSVQKPVLLEVSTLL
jgi:hypothetical protein